MKNVKVSSLAIEPFGHLMEAASAGFEHDCRQARRGLRMSVAVNVFGIGALIPNNSASEDAPQANKQLALTKLNLK
jgi:hypothetical protein